MKITSLETIRLAAFPAHLWLRVHTDAGLVGLGETAVDLVDFDAREFVEALF